MNKELIKKYKAEFDHWLNGGSILVKYANPRDAEEGYEDWHEDDKVWDSTLHYLIIINDSYSTYRKALAEGKTIQYYKCIYQHEMCVTLDRYDWVDLKGVKPDYNFTSLNKYRIKYNYPLYFKCKDTKYIVKFTGLKEGVVIHRGESTSFDKGFYSNKWLEHTSDKWESVQKPEEPQFKVGDWVITKDKEVGKIVVLNYRNPNYCKVINTHADKCEVGISIDDLTLWQPQPGEWCWFWNKEGYPFIARFKEYGKIGLFCPENFSATEFCEPFIGTLPTILKAVV